MSTPRRAGHRGTDKPAGCEITKAEFERMIHKVIVSSDKPRTILEVVAHVDHSTA